MKKIFLSIMCIMLITGCTTNDKKADKSNIDQVQEVKKVDEQNVQKVDQQQDKTVDKKEETEDKTKTETVKKEEKKETQKKSTSKKTTTKKKTSTTKKKTTNKKTTPKKKTNTITFKPKGYICIECGKKFTSYDKLENHLNKTNHGGYGIGHETEQLPKDWEEDLFGN